MSIAALTAAVLTGTASVSAAPPPAPGTLDPSFGSGGSARTTFGPSYGADARAVALYPDGRIVAVGRSSGLSDPSWFQFDFGLARYAADGSPDAAFGTGGRLTTDMGAAEEAAWVPLLQPDGKLVVVGNYDGAASGVRVARYEDSGALDTSFGTGGWVSTPMAGAIGYGAALQPDGAIVVAGVRTIGTLAGGFVARYAPAGTLDPSFGSGGIISVSAGGYRAVAVQPDGRIVAAGYSTGGGLLISRLDATGQPDPSFGAGSGSVSTTFTELPVSLWGLALQPDGRILAAGSRAAAEVAVVRRNADGSPDPTFGTAGLVTTDFFGKERVSVPLLQPDGKILVTGWGDVLDADGNEIGEASLLARYLPNGDLDPGFGTAGKVITPDYWRLRAIALQPDGNIIVAGGYDDQTGFQVARYIGGSGEPPPPADTTPPSVVIASPAAGASYSLGQVVIAGYSCDDPAAVATCSGTVATGASVDTSTAGEHVFAVSTTDGLGNAGSASVTYRVLAGDVSAPVSNGGTVTTDPGNVGASPAVPVQTTVVAPAGVTGVITVAPQATATPAPTGFSLFGVEVALGGPDASAAAPYEIRFLIDNSALGGVAPADVQVLRNGVPLTGCTDANAAAPDPCIVSRGFATGGDAAVVVRTSRFSVWSFGRLAYVLTGPLQPVDAAPTVNTAKAGSTIPVKFMLGGDRGLAVIADGFPKSTAASCAGAASDEVEQTLTGASALSYDSSSGVYTYKWKTTLALKGCRDLVIRFRDGSQLRALFRLR